MHELYNTGKRLVHQQQLEQNHHSDRYSYSSTNTNTRGGSQNYLLDVLQEVEEETSSSSLLTENQQQLEQLNLHQSFVNQRLQIFRNSGNRHQYNNNNSSGGGGGSGNDAIALK